MNRYLLDTNIVLFSLCHPEELDRYVKEIVDSYGSRLYISTVSIQEMIHLYKREKIQTNWKKIEEILPAIEAADFEILPVKKEHLITYSKLIPLDSHNDPNDHVIISQAITEKITLISSDGKFERYVKQKLDFIFNSRN
jgi:PIN domain nuclease of toxin-antitoxin system